MDIFSLFAKIEGEKKTAAPVSFLVVGLGNPGEQYDGTRHNAGFIAVDALAEKYGVKIDRAKFHALVAEVSIGGARGLLMKPQTYMNNSGTAVGEAVSFYKIPHDRVIILHDEISFEPGLLRIRRKGSAGGHNGLKSIIACLPGEDFPRIKIGVGQKPTPDYDLADWVLGKFPKAGADALRSRLPDIADAVQMILADNIDGAMQKYSK